MQARESVDLRQANVQDGEVPLQPGLLIDDQVGPPAADAGHGRRRQIEPGRVDLPGLLAGGLEIGFDRGGEAAVIRDDQPDVGMRRHIAGERGRPRLRVRVGGRVDLEVVDREPGFLQGVDRALGPQAARRLRQEPPDHRAGPGLEAGAPERLGRESGSGAVQILPDIPEPLGGVALFHLGQLCVPAGDDDPIGLGVFDQRIERGVPRVPHHRDPVRPGRRGLLELLDHLLRIPVREYVLHPRTQIEFGLPRAVVDVVGEHPSGRPAREEDDPGAAAPLGLRREAGGRAEREEPGERRRRLLGSGLPRPLRPDGDGHRRRQRQHNPDPSDPGWLGSSFHATPPRKIGRAPHSGCRPAVRSSATGEHYEHATTVARRTPVEGPVPGARKRGVPAVS